MFDYQSNTFRYNSRTYDLDLLRVWLMQNHPEIVLAHRVKRIYKEGTWEWTFDWDTVLFKVKDTLIRDFIKEYK